MSKNSVPSFQV